MNTLSNRMFIFTCLAIIFVTVTLAGVQNVQYIPQTQTLAIQPGIGGGPDEKGVSLENFATSPNNYIDQTITLPNVLVKHIFNTNIFSIMLNEKELLVISSYDSPPMAEQYVNVRGIVRRLPSLDVLEKEWKLNGDLPTSLSDVPVYIQETSI